MPSPAAVKSSFTNAVYCGLTPCSLKYATRRPGFLSARAGTRRNLSVGCPQGQMSVMGSVDSMEGANEKSAPATIFSSGSVKRGHDCAAS